MDIPFPAIVLSNIAIFILLAYCFSHLRKHP